MLIVQPLAICHFTLDHNDDKLCVVENADGVRHKMHKINATADYKPPLRKIVFGGQKRDYRMEDGERADRDVIVDENRAKIGRKICCSGRIERQTRRYTKRSRARKSPRSRIVP